MHGSRNNITCRLNSNNAILECQDGLWSDTNFRCPACVRAVGMDANVLLNSGAIEFYNGDFVSITCKKGSSLSGIPFTFCLQDGSFQFPLSDVTCKLDCNDPAIDQPTLLSTRDIYSHHSIALLSCADGYSILEGANQITCNNGVWNPSPNLTTCEVIL
nr:complement component receptor 1-like protein [Lytechinus pictus]